MKRLNRLSGEKSPYLLQHSHNPVDWYPWGNEAFGKAVKEDKPIFLSIGYSTCHWCHVMEKESFEDEEIAEMMNETFVSIKVDREERPDIDGIYMSVCQMLTGSGGWPLTIIMTPAKEPFFAGTYFPKDSRFGRQGLKEIIPRVKDVWQNKRDEINRSASEIVKALTPVSSASGAEIDLDIFTKAFNEFQRRYDPDYGGFGSAPKFPSPHNLNFLLRYYARYKNDEALSMVENTLLEMRKGGIYDHIGFGFHRYSTDRKWLVPHFEKMLYDQALLAGAYTELYQVNKKELYKNTVDEILKYVLREMTSPEGGFYSAEDADSEGVEGRFYLWTMEEINRILEVDTGLAAEVYNIREKGNFTNPLSEGEGAENILHLKNTFEQIAQHRSISQTILKEKIENIRNRLFEYREKRIHPYKDDKILTDWNGLMITAFAKAAMVFQDNLYRGTAVKAAEFIMQRLQNEDGKLLHRYRNGEAGITANIDDYAFMISALLELYEATFNIRWLKTAVQLNDQMIEFFWDNENGGFFFSPVYGEKLIARQKEIYDGAIPSGNSIALIYLLKLSRITGKSSFEEMAFRIVKTFSDHIVQSPSAFTQTLSGLDFGFGESLEIVIAGDKQKKETKDIISLLNRAFLPNRVILLKEPGDTELKTIAPFTEQMRMIDNKTTVYICRNFVCERPFTDPDEIQSFLLN